MRQREALVLAELVLSSDEVGEKKGEIPKSEVSIEHYRTPSNILTHHFINHICYSN